MHFLKFSKPFNQLSENVEIPSVRFRTTGLKPPNTMMISNADHESTSVVPTRQEIQSEMNQNLNKYKTDPAYRKQIQAKIELASKHSGHQDKQAY